MENTIKELKKEFPFIKIMVGGAVLNPDYALAINADYYSKDARGAVDIAKKVFSA
jgi:5-methyltetrahydrofolate--homocysteine methyltransferase